MYDRPARFSMRLTVALICALTACGPILPSGQDSAAPDATPSDSSYTPDQGVQWPDAPLVRDAGSDATDGRSDAFNGPSEAGVEAGTDAGGQTDAAPDVRDVGVMCPDSDGDGFPDRACGGTDCDDGDRAVYPGAPERCNGRDNDCDGAEATQPQRDAYCLATAPGTSVGRVSIGCAAPGPTGGGITFTGWTCWAVYTAPRYECWTGRGAASNCCDVTVTCPR